MQDCSALVWGLLSTCVVQVGSSLDAVCGLLSNCEGRLLSMCVRGICVPLKLW